MQPEAWRPPGLVICHTCMMPDHVEQVTHKSIFSLSGNIYHRL